MIKLYKNKIYPDYIKYLEKIDTEENENYINDINGNENK